MNKSPHVDYNGKLADSYESGRDITVVAEKTWLAAIEPHLAKAGVVVDVGAGTGRFARRIDDNFASYVIAVEPAHGMRASAQLTAEPADNRSLAWIGGTAESLPLRPKSADVLWSAFATHYYDLGGATREFARVVADDGLVLIWHAFSEVFDDLEWFRWFPEAREIDEERMPSRAEVVEAFEGVGFELIEHSVHNMLIASDLGALANRLSHRSISTLNLISDEAFETGLANLRVHAKTAPAEPVYASNVLLVFRHGYREIVR